MHDTHLCFMFIGNKYYNTTINRADIYINGKSYNRQSQLLDEGYLAVKSEPDYEPKIISENGGVCGTKLKYNGGRYAS